MNKHFEIHIEVQGIIYIVVIVTGKRPIAIGICTILYGVFANLKGRFVNIFTHDFVKGFLKHDVFRPLITSVYIWKVFDTIDRCNNYFFCIVGRIY